MAYVKSSFEEKNSRYSNKHLVRALKILKLTAAELSRLLNCNQGNLSQSLHDRYAFSLRYSLEIEKLTKGKVKASQLNPVGWAKYKASIKKKKNE